MICSKNNHLIDFIRLAKTGEAVRRAYTHVELPRCAQVASGETLSAEVEAYAREAYGHYFLELKVMGTISLGCERCGQDYIFELNSENQFVVIDHEFDELVEHYPDHEPVVKVDKSRIHLTQLVEEDILLSIPAIRRHEEDSHCSVNMAEFAV